MVGFPEPNQLALRLCTFGPTERYSCTQIPRKAIFWADLDHFWKVSSPKHVSWVRFRVTYVRRPLRYRYLVIHLTVCVQYDIGLHDHQAGTSSDVSAFILNSGALEHLVQ
jgi:hypothetical protein